MKLTKYFLMGTIFILLAIIIFFSNFLDNFIRPFTQVFLMGSSKGKDILFFGIFGLLLIKSEIFKYYKIKENSIITKFINFKIINKFLNIFKLKNKTYLKFSIILFLFAGIFGLILEIYMRNYLGIAPFTIFVAINPDSTTTSLLHSHIYKSAIGSIISSILTIIPSSIHTGDSLSQYTPQIANVIIIILALLFLTLLRSLKNRLPASRLILTFAATCGLIGLLDGGLFSTPYIIGIYGMLFVYFEEDRMNYYLGKIFKNKYLVDKTKDTIAIFKKRKSTVKKTFIRVIPHVFLLFIIILRLSLSIIGSNVEYYEVDILNPTGNIDLENSYSVILIEESLNKTTIHISPKYNEIELLNSLSKSLDNKSSSYSMTWNFFSYF
ncbi:MAG: hypothetical protein LBU74_01445 [Methanobacteriaceae archaeon]|jgi:hypothetical protein|nr:hypothetical protein [Candidatus Methanorudis spinitermitis]